MERDSIMGWNDHINDIKDEIITCSNCHKKYRQWIEEQEPGYKSMDFDRCPYCQHEKGSSMKVEYHNSKID